MAEVDLFTPRRLYGEPDDLRRFVDRAHELRHRGDPRRGLQPPRFRRLLPREGADAYFSDNHECEWGRAINFDGSSAEELCAFFIANAGYWIEEFHFDGQRLGATQQIFDASAHRILDAIAAEARARVAAQRRVVLLVAENQPQDARLVRTRDKGAMASTRCGTTISTMPLWSPSTGRREAKPQRLCRLGAGIRRLGEVGLPLSGQYYARQKQRRGRPPSICRPRPS